MEYPLQTRAALLTPDRMVSQERAARALDELAGRGYNTLVVPLLWEGETTFRTNSEGRLAKGSCGGREVFARLAEHDFTVWLMADILSAGPAAGRLGRLAAGNRHWLMRTVAGEYAPPQHPTVPGLFCWTSIPYRRFLGNYLVDVFDAFPADALVMDLRLMPRTAPDPATWTHLGFSSLQRIQRELGFDVEQFLVNPTAQVHNTVVNWRDEQLHVLLEHVKARVQKMRRQMPMYFAATIGSPNDPWAPWGPWVRAGTAEAVILHAPAEQVVEHADAMDRMVGGPYPFLVGIDGETDLADLGRRLGQVGATGFCVLHPGPLQRVVMPAASYSWAHHGAVEEHPITAALEIAESVADQFEDCQMMRPFFKKMAEYLARAGEKLQYEVAVNIRQDMLDTLRRIRNDEVAIQGDKAEAIHKIDLLARLLLLAQVPVVE